MASIADRADRADRRRAVLAFAQAASKAGMNYALTIQPDIRLPSSTPEKEAERLLMSVCRASVQGLNLALAQSSGRRWSKRDAKRLPGVDFMGFSEVRDGRGVFNPHAHLAIHLSAALLPAAEAFFIDRIGLKTNRDEIFTPRQGTAISSYLGRQSHVYLEPIYGIVGWSGYCMKGISEISREMLPTQFVSERLSYKTTPAVHGFTSSGTPA